MNKNYTQSKQRWAVLLMWLGLWLTSAAAHAQSGPIGNEWIVPGQTYYKMKIVRDGLYKIDYQYLTQAGITGVVPNELQIWRRGREIATYVGGSRTTLDATSFIEFYAVHNDGRLDAELYKNAADQPHQYFSLYTDTASYFLTWRAGTAGRHMQEPAAAGGTVHPHTLRERLTLRIEGFVDYPETLNTYLPWMQAGEGFYMNGSNNANKELTYTLDSVSVNSASTGPLPRVEVLLFGGQDFSQRAGGTGIAHHTQVIVIPPGGTERVLGVMNYVGLVRARQTFALQASDISSTGTVVIKLKSVAPVAADDYFVSHYLRTIAPQAPTWLASRNRLLFQNDSLLSGPATYELANVPATVAGFDINDLYNVQRVVATSGATAGLKRFVFPGATAAATHRLMLADEATLPKPLPARRVRFRTINPAVPTFTIITHPQLMGAVGTVPNAARAYANYRASTAGGHYDTLMVTSQQLYDQFFYGEKSWLALRHFTRWLAAATPNATNRYLLLLGKGIVPSEPVGGAYFARNGELGLDLVPTSSRSVSDNLLTADYANNNFVARLHTGRLTVTTPQQVVNYLNKVIDQDLQNLEPLGTQPWRKNVLHLVGAKDANEAIEYKSYMDAAKARVERPLFGGHVETEVRNTPLPVNVDISAQLNAGLSLISYFGHAAPTAFTFNFGMPSNMPAFANYRKYPFLFLSGCSANSTFTRAATVVEDWLFADRKGALGSLAESGFSYATPLSIAQDTLYKLLFNDPAWYGRPITVVHDEVVRRLQSTFTQDYEMEQLLCTGWQGDPTLSLYAPPLPDFIASSAKLSIVPAAGQTTVRADSRDFVLNVGVSNPGKIPTEPLEIRVTRKFPPTPTRADSVYSFTVRAAWGPDTTYALPMRNSVGASGSSTFVVMLDPNNRITEVSETNNSAQIDYTFLSGGVSVLNPTEFAIVGSNRPRLVVQSNNLIGTQRDYDFEIDTVATFNGAVQRTTITAGLLAEWTPTLPASLGQRDSLVWYWRARFHTPAAGESGDWTTSSLRVIPGSPGGWSQSHYTQFKQDTRTGVEVNAPTGRWEFAATRVPLVLRTRGGGPPRSPANFAALSGAGIYIRTAAGQPSVSGCGVRSPNLLIAVYSGASLLPVAMPASYQQCGQAPDNFYYFSVADPASTATAVDTLDNLNYSATRQQQLNDFLTAIPAGSYVAVVSANRLRYSLLPTALKTRLQTLLGSRLITQLADGEPLALLGQKLTATTGRLMHETGPDASSTIAKNIQTIVLRDTLQQSNPSGRIVSTRIGPSKQWTNLYSTIRTLTPNGQHTLSVVGIDSLGHETVVLPNVTRAVEPLTSVVSAKTYPYLRLELALSDNVTRIPPQLEQWLVTSQGVPEGVVRRDLATTADYDPAKFARQAADSAYITFPVKFQNISDAPFAAPLITRVNLRSTTGGQAIVATADVSTNTVLLPGNTLTIPVKFSMIGKFGTFVVEVVVNPRLQREQNYANNELSLPQFTVIDRNVPPTIDVAFDGRHILNGELVSAMPVINIQLNDEDKFRHITDASFFTVLLQRPGQTVPTVMDVNSNNFHFSVDQTNGSVAKLVYEPGKTGPLPDGMYTLEVQGRDPSNSSAGAQNFQVKFEVVNASQISNVYPYPNPVVSKARFVFTLTGQELPRNMKIQIVTLTGKVVREIFMNELGPLHIGNNITDFAWDGTDTYGDRLANGTYLYRVALDDPGAQFGHRATGGDKAFKNDWGKLVLMR
ncbi:hypothetical protein KB206_00090 [Microvirga sp. STS02]|uniref:putative type IX secretion system sortase PorU2 n=1 Tax=Hymenobacter negativus TaxID=2795026 RepID=UPI0018DD0D49|nr:MULTISPECIES: C25 family cysteine peptidase [Bacteria]MBH8567264.1 hypothetical protein [Hymenobacter negativus]MBR7206996.1 hypothetical protein [Microvirga sp. STS02]